MAVEVTVDDTDVEVEVSVQRGAETMKERDRADLGIRTGSWTRISQRGANSPQEDAQHSAGDPRVVVQEGPEAFRHREHPLARSRPYGGHYTTDRLPGSGMRTPPESRSHNRHTVLVRIHERECHSADRPGSRARPMRARRPPWGPPRRPVRGTSRGGAGPADRAASG